jgi:hypothetical protein
VSRSRTILATALLALALVACAGPPAATPFQPTILAFQATTCDELATEFWGIGDPSFQSVIDGPDQIADERKSVLMARMQDLLVLSVTQQAREAGVIAECAMPGWLQRAERGFSDALRQKVGAAAYDGDPVITYDAWLLALNDQLIRAGMGKG